MPLNKNAYLRYQIIDSCLRNIGRKYSTIDLLEKVNEALLEEDPKSTGIEMRQFRNDLKALKLPPFNAPIESKNEGKYYFYTYSDPDFSINKVPLNESETQQLQQTIQMLERFIGNENFAWLNELTPMLRDRFGMKSENTRLISLETDEYNTGKEYVSQIFNAASNKRVLNVEYTSFEGITSIFYFHPYHLKRSNNRWFALGRNEENDNPQWVVPLDRIILIKETDKKYIEYPYNWDEHFEDFLGITKNEGEMQEIILHFPKQQAKYVITKPIHGNQKARWLDEDTLEVKLNLIPNYELQTRILSFGEKVQLIAPLELKDIIKKRLEKASNQYH
jgi:predicted DNA-binding transcriptional regulator YafY